MGHSKFYFKIQSGKIRLIKFLSCIFGFKCVKYVCKNVKHLSGCSIYRSNWIHECSMIWDYNYPLAW